MWSLNNQARLLAAQRTSIPQPIDSSNTLLNKPITHMACSSGCAAAVYDATALRYSIYIWGVWEASSYGFEPSLLVDLPANISISEMVHCEAQVVPPFSAGVPYLLVLLSDGTVWSAGTNIDNNRGMASPASEFTQITAIDRYISKIACGSILCTRVFFCFHLSASNFSSLTRHQYRHCLGSICKSVFCLG